MGRDSRVRRPVRTSALACPCVLQFFSGGRRVTLVAQQAFAQAENPSLGIACETPVIRCVPDFSSRLRRVRAEGFCMVTS